MLLVQIHRRGLLLASVGDQIDEGRGRAPPTCPSSMLVRARLKGVEMEKKVAYGYRRSLSTMI
jgi:hypothetical protein